jgi:hypothetical protein
MKVLDEVVKVAIGALVRALGHGNVFSRIKALVVTADNQLESASGSIKKDFVVSSMKVIFRDLAVPVGEAILNLLLELAVAYVKRSK